MAAKGTIGGKIVLEGEKQYKDALKSIKSEQAELRSEMKLSQATFKDSQNSLEALKQKYEILEKQIESQTEKISVNQQAMAFAAQKQEKAAAKIEELKAALAEAEKSMQEMTDSSGDNSEAMEQQTKKIEELKGKLALAEEGYSKAEQKTKTYQSAMNNASAELKGMEQELNQTAKYLDEAEKSTDQCAESIDEYGKETQNAAKETSVFGDVLKANLMSEAVVAGVKKLCEGIKDIAAASIEVGGEFESSMSNVAATMGMTADEINSGSESYKILENAAKECGATTKYSASEAADGLNYLALAGYSAEKSAATLPKVLDVAAAGGLDLAYASDLVTDSMAALSLETSDLDNYIDEMARTSQKSNTSIAQLGEATLVCAGTVNMTGQSLETMNAELGVLANNGIKGAEGGTHLRNVLLRLAAPTDIAAQSLDELGVQVSDADGNMRDLNDILIDMNTAMSDMSSEEKTQIISRIFEKTDIAAVNALMKGTNGEFENLSNELKNCSGAAKSMADTMNNNLKGKVTILKSSLEALGISAYDVFDDEMKVAVEGATQAVGRLQKSIEHGELGVSLDKLSKSMGEFFENAIEVGEDALPVVIDGFTWLLDHADLLIAGITGIAAANMQMKVVAPAIEAVQMAWTAYKTANEGATVAQWLLNTAMSANPAGLLITAIVGLTAAVGAYCLINKDSLAGMSETSQKTQELIDKTKELNEAYEASAQERKDTITNIDAEGAAAKKLVGELQTLQSKTKLTAEEQARQKMIVEQLNQVMPDLNLEIDEQTGKMNMSTDAILDNIDAMMALDRAAAAREHMSQIAEEQFQAELQLYDLQQQLTAVTEERKTAEEELAAAMDNTTEVFETNGMSADGARMKYAELSSEEKELEEQIAATRESVGGLTEEYQYCCDTISDTESIYGAKDATEELGDAAADTGEDISVMADGAVTAVTDMCTSLTESIQGQISLFSEFKGEMALTTEELLANMDSQVTGIKQWADNMETLAERGIDQGLLQHLADMGPEGAGYVATFAAMTDEELKNANALWQESLTVPNEAAEQIAAAYQTAGEQAAGGYATGITDNTETAGEAGTALGEEVLGKTVTALGSEDGSSKEMQKVGQSTDAGLSEGIRTDQQLVLDAVANVGGNMITTAQNELKYTTFKEIGFQVPRGLEDGIRAGKSGVVNAVVEMCTEAVRTAQSTLAWLGEMSAEGYVDGLSARMAEHRAEINGLIELSYPETSMMQAAPEIHGGGLAEGQAAKKIEINQEIHIHSMTDDLVETTRKFKYAQQEAAEAW